MAVRILHVVDTLRTGGLEKGLVKLISSMSPDRFEHVICTVRDLGGLVDELPKDRTTVLQLEHPSGRLPVHTPQLLQIIRKVKPHIVHSRNWGAIEAVVAGALLRCRTVHSEHGLESVGAGVEPLRRRWFRRVCFELATHVFTVSDQLRTHYAQTTGCPLTRIGVIHNGVDTERFQPRHDVRTRMRQALGLQGEEFCIGTVGRLEPVKAIATLLEAASRLPESMPSWQLLIAGDGSEFRPLQEFAHQNSLLRTRVRFLGELRNIPEYLNALDLYVLPSRYEGISNSLLEAMATGLPVIASAVGGNLEVVVDGESGLLFPAGDVDRLAHHLCRLLLEHKVRERLARAARLRVRSHFSLESMVNAYEQLYTNLVSRPALKPASEATAKA